MFETLKSSNYHRKSEKSILFYVAIVCILATTAYGDDTLFSPGYSSLLELQSQVPDEVDNIPSNVWKEAPDAAPLPPGSRQKFGQRQLFHETEIQRDTNRLAWADSPQNPANQEPTPMINERYLQDIIQSQSSLSSREYTSSSDEDNDNLVTFGSSIWNKRGAADAAAKGEKKTTTTTQTEGKEIYTQEDKMLETLEPNKKCYKNLKLCSHLNKYECLMSCYLNRVLEKPNTKFLFRLIHQFKSFGKFLCPTFGSIYPQIPGILRKGLKKNKLSSFLKEVGIKPDLEHTDLDFIKNSPLVLFNNLVKFGNGSEFEIIKPILSTAEDAAKAEMSGRGLAQSLYNNPVCQGVADKGWIFSMINTMTKHPSVSDMFLKGYWTMTRALSIGVPYPLDGLFTSWLLGIKVLAGAECGLISYAEQGKRFKCKQKSPVEEILDAYKKEVEKKKKKNPLDWLVCGAHQIRFPKWFKTKVRKQEKKNEKSGRGRSDDGEDDEEGEEARFDVPQGADAPFFLPMDKVMNPDEFYVDED